MDVFLGIDTSCYTTSLCLVDSQYGVVADERQALSVRAGGRGLSQSEMVYQHVRNLPALTENLAPYLAGNTIRAVAVTDKPRRRADSYMPAFLSGLGCARALAAVLGVPLYRISHQENHLLAVLRTAGHIDGTAFRALHLSGGTTELLLARPDADGLDITRTGGTSDISAGQFIDRVGVALGLPFPAGKAVEELSRGCLADAAGGAVWSSGGEISFSGREAELQRRIAAGKTSAGALCAETLQTVWQGIRRLVDWSGRDGNIPLLAAGGVMENSFLRRTLADYAKKKGFVFIPAEKGYSADNASGAAFWAAWRSKQGGAV